jgi:hypothetical protein
MNIFSWIRPSRVAVLVLTAMLFTSAVFGAELLRELGRVVVGAL